MSNVDIEGGAPDEAAPDPFSVFIENHQRKLQRKRGVKRFNAGEHAWLGSRGAELACETAEQQGLAVDKEVFAAIPRRANDEVLQYGEIVALSGDFYESPDALFEEKPSPVPWLWQANDLSDLREVFAEELNWIEARQRGATQSPYPDENIRLAWNAKSYVELALRNTDHFGWHNIRAYCRHHSAALRLAQSAAGKKNETFRRALYTNAFADHFLTDGFAAGHIRVPRAEICKWADANGLNNKIAGALSKLLHDQDGHIGLVSLHGTNENERPADDGLLVQNGNDDSWRTFCDGQLFLKTNAAESSAVKHAVAAVQASVVELLLAWKRYELPDSNYHATHFVPFPHRDGPTLVDKFPADLPEADLEKLWQSVSWYAKIRWLSGLERTHVHDLFKALPGIMAEFRAHIADAAADPQIVKRIDPKYIAAYKQIA